MPKIDRAIIDSRLKRMRTAAMKNLPKLLLINIKDKLPDFEEFAKQILNFAER